MAMNRTAGRRSKEAQQRERQHMLQCGSGIMDRTGGRKGIFAIISAFFLIIAVIVALMWFLGIYQAVFRINAVQGKHEEKEAAAQAFKDRLLACHEKTLLAEEKLESAACSLSGAKGYRVVQDTEYNSCAQKSWSAGASPPDAQTYAYWMIVRQKDGTTCPSKLYIYE
jgi:hypothetical protein